MRQQNLRKEQLRQRNVMELGENGNEFFEMQPSWVCLPGCALLGAFIPFLSFLAAELFSWFGVLCSVGLVFHTAGGSRRESSLPNLPDFSLLSPAAQMGV